MPSRPYKDVTANYSVTRTDDTLFVNSTSGAITVTLPDASQRRAPLKIVRTAGANTVTIDPFGSDTVGGSSSMTLNAIGASVELQPKQDDYVITSSHGAVSVGGKTQVDALVGTATWNPAATAATQGAVVTTTVSVTGAALGDPVVVSHTAFDNSLAAVLEAHVSLADTVSVKLVNTTAVAVDLATGTLKVVVLKS